MLFSLAKQKTSLDVIEIALPGVLPYIGYRGMCGAKGCGFLTPFWSEIGYTFSHLGLKSGRFLYTLWNRGPEFSVF